MTTKTNDADREAFEASMQGVAYPSKKPVRSNWEQMCQLATEAERVYPEGHWPTEFTRIAELESELNEFDSDSDLENMSYVDLFEITTVKYTDTETGEEITAESSTPVDPYNVGIDKNDAAATWLYDHKCFKSIEVSLNNAGTIRFVNDILKHMEKHCSSRVHQMVYDAKIVIKAMKRIGSTNAPITSAA